MKYFESRRFDDVFSTLPGRICKHNHDIMPYNFESLVTLTLSLHMICFGQWDVRNVTQAEA